MTADAYVKSLVDQAPPLTGEQVARLSTLLSPALRKVRPGVRRRPGALGLAA